MEMVKTKRGQAAGIVVIVIGVIVGIILIVGVAVPIVKSVVSSSNLTGTDATIGTYLTTFLLIGALVLIAGIAIFGLVARK